jgi:iron complex outermembrane receptor protein
VIDQVSRDWGAELRLESTAALAGRPNRFTLGVEPAYGNVDDRNYQNVAGEPGALAKSQREVAGGVAVYAEDAWRVAPRLTTVLGARWGRDVRRVEDHFLSDGDQSGRRLYRALMPRVGLLYELPGVSGQLFANASRSYEPPLLLELNSLTVPGLVELEAQDAWQFELGSRGRHAGLDWDVALYDVELRNELLNRNTPPYAGAPFTVPTYRNARRTRHYGVETGVGYTLPWALLTPAHGGDRLGVRLAHTFGRYRFVDDGAFSGKQIPGAPQHVLQGELAYRHPSGLTLRPSLEWVPGSYFVDSGNTVRNQGWTVLNLRAELLVQRLRSTVFVEGRNLTNTVYSPAVQVDDGAGRFFNPADPRSLYAGVRWQPGDGCACRSPCWPCWPCWRCFPPGRRRTRGW